MFDELSNLGFGLLRLIGFNGHFWDLRQNLKPRKLHLTLIVYLRGLIRDAFQVGLELQSLLALDLRANRPLRSLHPLFQCRFPCFDEPFQRRADHVPAFKQCTTVEHDVE